MTLPTKLPGDLQPYIPNDFDKNWHQENNTPCANGRIANFMTAKERSKYINEILIHLRKHSRHFDAIAVSGYSAALVAPIIAHRMKKNLILVRKDSESRHSTYLVEGPVNQRYIIIDDIIDSGHTLKFIEERVATCLEGKLYGVYLYRGGSQYSVDGVFPGKAIKYLNPT